MRLTKQLPRLGIPTACLRPKKQRPHTKRWTWVLSWVLLVGLAQTSPAQARDTRTDTNGKPATSALEDTARDGNELVAMNFQEVEIPVLARFISEITNKNFIVDEKVRGKVTIISPTRVSPDEAYAVFQSVLQVKGFTTVSNGTIVKIVPRREAKQIGLPTLFNGSLATAGDEFITRLVPLHHVAAKDMEPVLQPMVSPDGLLIPYAPTNSLILTDSAPNVRRFLTMLEELDIEGYERTTEVIPLQHAIAADLAKKIEDIMKESEGNERPPVSRRVKKVTATNGASPLSSGLGSPVRVIPDERTNSLIAMAGPLELKAIRRVVARLDVPLPSGISKINVYPLKYANAEELLPVLADLVGASTGRNDTRSVGAPRRERRSRREFQPSANRFGPTVGQQSFPSGPTPGSSPSPISATGTTPELSGEVSITADPATNSLIISAAPQDYAILKEVIEQLDIRRRQVYVEAIILEVSVDRLRELGIEWQGAFSINGQGVGLGRVNLGDLNSAITNPGSLSGLLLAAASNQTITLPDGTVVPAKFALLRAAQSSNDINVLSAPTLLTTDNEEAEILVGENVPFIASQATDSSQLDNLFTTVERKDIGITLRLTPQISDNEHVRLDIYEEVSAIVPTSPFVGNPEEVGPTTSVRLASTTVVVRNGQTVVIGGLIADDSRRERRTVPYLGNIPVLGNFFRSDRDTIDKVNLLIFLTPNIVQDDSEIAQYSTGARDHFRRFLKRNKAPAQWQQQLDRPSFAQPGEQATDGVLLPATGGTP